MGEREGGVVGGGGGQVAGGRLYLPLGHRQQCCVFSKWQKQVQSTGWIKTVIGSSLAPFSSLLMPFTNSTDPVVYLDGLTGLAKIRL